MIDLALFQKRGGALVPMPIVGIGTPGPSTPPEPEITHGLELIEMYANGLIGTLPGVARTNRPGLVATSPAKFENINFLGDVLIQSPGVSFYNCTFTAQVGTTQLLRNGYDKPAHAFTASHCVIDGANKTETGVAGAGSTIAHSVIKGCMKSGHVNSGYTFEAVLASSHYNDPGDGHREVILANRVRDITIRKCYFVWAEPGERNVSTAVAAYGGAEGQHNFLIEDTVLMGGAYSLYMGDVGSTNLKARRNVFLRDGTRPYSGPLERSGVGTVGFEWTDNRWDSRSGPLITL